LSSSCCEINIHGIDRVKERLLILRGLKSMGNLISDQFMSDERIAKAQRLIQEALSEHQKKVTGPKPPDPDLAMPYQTMVRDLGKLRGGDLLYPYIGSGFGNGALVELADGSIKYDFITGIGVHYWGHSHPKVIDAAVRAGLSDTPLQGNLQQNANSAALLALFIELAQKRGSHLEHCFLSSSGAMSNENALKMILQKHYPADRILCFKGCFAGRTLAMSQITDKAAYRDGLPSVLNVEYVPFYDHADPRGSRIRAQQTLKEHLSRYPNQHAGMCFELIIGEGGFYPGEHEFFLSLIEILKGAGIAVWIDEVQTFGRTSEPFAFQYFGLDEYVDVVTVGKMSQVCATLFRADYRPRPGLVSQTFTSSTAAIETAIMVLKSFRDGDYFGDNGTIMRCHRRFVEHLIQIKKQFPQWVQGPYGLGAMIGFTPFGGDAKHVWGLARALFDAGVIAFIAGSNPTRLRFLMPIAAVKPEDIDRVARLISDTIESYAKEHKL
jgi:4-aminobutyrate aminotransferase-like enzyme